MKIFDYMEQYGYEELALYTDEAAGLRALICIHDTTLGPACGGTRMWPFATEEEAILDVLRLARAMTYKSSLAGLDYGGGKAVIIADSTTDKSRGPIPRPRPFRRHHGGPFHHHRGRRRREPGRGPYAGGDPIRRRSP